MLSVWIAIVLLIFIVLYESWLKPTGNSEGFVGLVSVGNSSFWQNWMPRRGDVGLNPTGEPDGYIRNIRYFAGYTDVQHLGQDHDFCRMVLPPSGKEDEQFFACALGGTEGLSSVKYRTLAVVDGFEISRDDYMNNGYCRILKRGDGFQAMCNPIGDTSFKKDLIVDPTPPPNIVTLLSFYEGIVFWLRFRDDLLDYAKNLNVSTAGKIEIDELPRDITEGLEFNGVDQFLRLGDDPNLQFGDVVQLRYLRATSFWVYFEEFTNNAKIYDFGNGPNQDNVFVGIVGRGNIGAQQEEPKLCVDEALKTIPQEPSGAQGVTEVSPQVAFATSRANIETYDCPAPDIYGRIMPPLEEKAPKPDAATSADLLYEIFEGKMRKLHVQVKNVFQLKKWTHIVITTTNNAPFSSGLKIYANGKVVHSEENAFLPQTNYTTNNYIGKSNWSSVTSQYDNADQLFKGKLFDFRGYRTAATQKKIKDTHEWGQKLLGLNLKSI